MEAWPIEEAYGVRPVGSLLLIAVLPFLARAASQGLATDEATRARVRAPLRGSLLGVAFAIGGTALGPALAASPDGAASLAAAVLGAAVGGLADLRAAGPGDLRALAAGLVLAPLASAGAAALGVPHAIPFGAAILAVAGIVAHRPTVPATEPAHALGWALGAAASLLLVAALAAPYPLTAIPPEDAPHHGDATWRLRVDPWDGTAMLANGWAARERGELARAVACAREARRMGAGVGPTLELEAEVLAARGECDAARRTFDRALRARARASFEEGSFVAPLVLGGYQLPPTLVIECGGLDDLPGLDDLTPP